MKIDFESYLIHYLQNNEFKIKQISINDLKENKDSVSISKEAQELYQRHNGVEMRCLFLSMLVVGCSSGRQQRAATPRSARCGAVPALVESGIASIVQIPGLHSESQ